MAVKKFDKIYYRTAAAPISTIAFTGSTPSGWTALPGTALVSDSKIDQDKAVSTPVQDGTEFIGSDKATLEFSIINFAAADYATLRAALINNLVDILMIDSDNKAPAYCLWAARLYPKLNSEEEPKITVSGTKERSSGATTPPATIINVT